METEAIKAEQDSQSAYEVGRELCSFLKQEESRTRD